MRAQTTTIAVAFIVFLLLEAPVVQLAPHLSGGPGEDRWEASAEVTPVPTTQTQIYMQDNQKLSAERPEGNPTPFKTKVPSSFKAYGPLGKIGYNEEQYVGTWNSNDIRFRMVTAGSIVFRLWVWVDGSRSGTFNLSLYKNDDPMNLVATATFRGISISNTPRVYETRVPLTMNNTEFMPRDKLSLAIYATVNGGCFVMYGTPERDTGMILTADSLVVEGVKAGKSGFSLRYKDAFGVPPSSMLFYAEVDNRPLKATELALRDYALEGLSTIVTWHYHLDGGIEHEFKLSVSYGGERSTNLTAEDVIFIKQEVDEGLFPGVDNSFEETLIYLIVAFTVIMVLAAVASILKKGKREREKLRVKRFREFQRLKARGILPPDATLAHFARYKAAKKRDETRARQARKEMVEAGREAGKRGSGSPVPETVVLEPVD